MDGRTTRVIVAAAVSMALVLALSACEPAVPEEPTVPEDPTDILYEVEQAATVELSDKTGIPVEDMVVVEATSTEWPDACLGLGEPDEVCAELITPGWELTIHADGEYYVVRTDEFGDTIRVEQ